MKPKFYCIGQCRNTKVAQESEFKQRIGSKLFPIKILDTGKVLVYCGYGHANEKETTKGKRMAGHLKEKLGIDPITIIQSYFIGVEHELTDKLKTSRNKPYLLKLRKIEKLGYNFMLWEDNPNYFMNAPKYIYQLGKHRQEISCEGTTL